MGNLRENPEMRLKRYGKVMRIEEQGRRAIVMEVQGRRRRGRPKRRCLDSGRDDIRGGSVLPSWVEAYIVKH